MEEEEEAEGADEEEMEDDELVLETFSSVAKGSEVFLRYGNIGSAPVRPSAVFLFVFLFFVLHIHLSHFLMM